jgi:hypothetical protein
MQYASSLMQQQYHPMAAAVYNNPIASFRGRTTNLSVVSNAKDANAVRGHALGELDASS